jgi:uncharacterized repeat protein (TIGR04138 family)
MDTPDQVFGKIEKLVCDNPQYKFEAYGFIMAALHFTVTKIKPQRHVTGQELCDGIRAYAIEQFGPLARTVLEHWGIHKTVDFGKIVFALVDIGLMRKTKEDSLNDFKDVYDFESAFSTKAIFDS